MFSSLPPKNKKKRWPQDGLTWPEYLKQIMNSDERTANDLLDRAATFRQESKKDFDDYFIPDCEERSHRRKWSDPKVRALAANNATLLKKNDRYANELTRAFELFGLDPANPYNWRTLLEFFALAHFETHTKNVGRRKWTTSRYCKLIVDWEAKRKTYPGKPDTFICDRLVEDDRYKQFKMRAKQAQGKGGRLRRALQDAKSEKNSVFKFLVDFHLQQTSGHKAADAAKASLKAAQDLALRDILNGDCWNHPYVAFELALPEI